MSDGTAGIGFGIVVLMLISVFWSARPPHDHRGGVAGRSPGLHARLLQLAPWFSLLVFMTINGANGMARFVAAYYPLLFPLLLAGRGQAALVRRKWWQRLGLLIMVFACGMLVTARDRPLFPAQSIFSWLHEKWPQAKLVSRTYNTVSTISTLREAARRPFQGALPPGEKVIGYAVREGSLEPSLRRPFGSRRVERIMPEDTPDELRAEGIRYVVVEENFLKQGQTLEGWLAQYRAVLVQQLTTKIPSGEAFHVYLVRLLP